MVNVGGGIAGTGSAAGRVELGGGTWSCIVGMISVHIGASSSELLGNMASKDISLSLSLSLVGSATVVPGERTEEGLQGG